MKLKNHIVYIVGFMGSGKSTIGKKLASRLNWSFLDLDDMIEENAGKPISELFSQNGEKYFRNIESEVLRSLKSETNVVVSTGGGTPCHSGNMDYMTDSGLTLYLKLTSEQLFSRLAGSKGQRPLIMGLNDEELLAFINEKLSYREAWYNRAKIIVEGINLDVSLLHGLVESGLDLLE